MYAKVSHTFYHSPLPPLPHLSLPNAFLPVSFALSLSLTRFHKAGSVETLWAWAEKIESRAARESQERGWQAKAARAGGAEEKGWARQGASLRTAIALSWSLSVVILSPFVFPILEESWQLHRSACVVLLLSFVWCECGSYFAIRLNILQQKMHTVSRSDFRCVFFCLLWCAPASLAIGWEFVAYLLSANSDRAPLDWPCLCLSFLLSPPTDSIPPSPSINIYTVLLNSAFLSALPAFVTLFPRPSLAYFGFDPDGCHSGHGKAVTWSAATQAREEEARAANTANGGPADYRRGSWRLTCFQRCHSTGTYGSFSWMSLAFCVQQVERGLSCTQDHP